VLAHCSVLPGKRLLQRGFGSFDGRRPARPRKRRLFVLTAAVGLVAVAVLALCAGASRADRLYIGVNLHFTGPDTTAGTFVMSGALEDSGTSHVEHISVVPIGNTDTARLSGDQTYVGQKGTIVTHFEGKAFPCRVRTRSDADGSRSSPERVRTRVLAATRTS
jgi:hypothetical protein